MGNAASGQDDAPAHDWDQFDGIDTLGYRVLGVQPDSPASQAGLVSFFDFLVGANGQILLGTGEFLEEGEEYDDVDFPALLQEFLNKPLELLVWNIKAQEKRLVTIIPRSDWGGAGLLGVTIRLDNYGGADERLIRVLETEPQSPAAIAGLVPLQDYLLGTTTDSFTDTSVLASVLHHSVDHVVELYVYNTDSDVVRVVSLMPTWSWGGNGLLGAEVGTGYLHRLPVSCRNTIGTSTERKVRWVGNEAAVPVVTTEETAPTGPPAMPLLGHAPAAQAQKPSQPSMLQVEPQLEMEVEDEDSARPEDTNKTIQQVADHSVPAAAPPVASAKGPPPPAVATTEAASVSVGKTDSAPILNQETKATRAEDTLAATLEATAALTMEPQVPVPEVPPKEAVPIPAPEPTVHPPPQEKLPDPTPAAAAPPIPESTVRPPTYTAPTATYTAPPAMYKAPPPPPPADAATLFAGPPPPVAAASQDAASSFFMPPPPMSFLSKEKEVDLR